MHKYSVQVVLAGPRRLCQPLCKINLVGVLEVVQDLLVDSSRVIELEAFELNHENRWQYHKLDA